MAIGDYIDTPHKLIQLMSIYKTKCIVLNYSCYTYIQNLIPLSLSTTEKMLSESTILSYFSDIT